jgi:pSer/pThr/pTyr-binding forkhead associated (FHA) protein
VITCSRCGKENQDLYKFCLGCGAKLQPAAAPAAKPAALPDAYPATPPPELAAAAMTTAPPSPEAFAAVAQAFVPAAAPALVPDFAPPVAPTPPPSVAAPMQAAVHFGLQSSAPASVPSVQIGIGSVPMQVPTRPNAANSPVAGIRPMTAVPATGMPMASASQPVHAPFSAPVVETVACPHCGKPVAAAFAFCGGCGHRMKAAPGAVGEAAIQRADAVAPTPARMGPRGHLTLIRPDGTEGGVFPLQEGPSVVGRGKAVLFDSDPYLSPEHVEFVLTENGLEVRDRRSLNGVFVRITDEETLASGDSFRIGQELLRFDAINPITPLDDGTEIIGTPNPGYWGRLSVVVGRDLDGPAFPLFEEKARLGRERGDILFPEDGYVSGAHCELSIRDGRVFIKDLGSSNGTFLRVRESRSVPSGSLMLMGQQLFRVAFK